MCLIFIPYLLMRNDNVLPPLFPCHLSIPLIPQMSQELGIIEKTPDFTNPYRTERDDVSKMHACCSTLSIS